MKVGNFTTDHCRTRVLINMYKLIPRRCLEVFDMVNCIAVFVSELKNQRDVLYNVVQIVLQILVRGLEN